MSLLSFHSLLKLNDVSSLSVGDIPPSSQPDDEVRGSVKAAIACIVVFSILAIIRTWWYALRRTPIQGSGIGVPPACGQGRPRPPTSLLAVSFIAFILKISALGVDSWATFSEDGGKILFGLVRYRFEYKGETDAMTYAKLCELEVMNETTCHTIRTGGALTLLAGVLTLFLALAAMLTLLKMRGGPQSISLHVARLYRFAGLTHVYTTLALLYWILGDFIVLDDIINHVEIGASFWLFLAATILDGFVNRSSSATLINTLPYDILAQQPLGEQPQPGSYVPPQPVQVVYAVPVIQQQQPQQQQTYLPVAQPVAAQGYGQVPVVYGQPQQYGVPQQQQQLQQQYAGQPQQFQPQPAYNPYGQPSQH